MSFLALKILKGRLAPYVLEICNYGIQYEIPICLFCSPNSPSTADLRCHGVDARVEPLPVPRLHGRIDAEEDARRRRDSLRSDGESGRRQTKGLPGLPPHF